MTLNLMRLTVPRMKVSLSSPAISASTAPAGDVVFCCRDIREIVGEPRHHPIF